MNETAINEEYERIVHFLDQKRLSEALNRLEVFAQDMSDWGLKNSLEELQTSYRYMLQYMPQITNAILKTPEKTKNKKYLDIEVQEPSKK